MTIGVERLLLIIDANEKGAVRGINATTAASGRMGAEVSAQSKVSSTALLGIGAAGVLAGGLAAKGLGNAVDAVESASKDVLKLQRLTGGSAEEASKLRFEAQQSGVSIDKLSTSLSILSTKGDKLDKIGVSLREADGAARPFNDVLGDIAQKVADLPAGQQRVDLARELFGRGGADLLPLLQRGRDGLEALQKAAEDFGVVLSQDTLDQVKRNIVATREWTATWEGLKLQVGNEVLPAVTAVAEGATKVGKAITDIPGLGSLVSDLGIAGAGIGIVGGGATLLVAAGTKVKSTWATLPSLFGATAAAESEDAAAKLANAEASNVAAAAADRYASAERRAAGAAASSAEAAAGAGASKTTGSLAGIGRGVGSVALAVGAGVIAADVVGDIVNSIRQSDDKLSDAYTHLAATSAKGGRETVSAFIKAAREEEAKLEVGDILHIGESIAGRFQLGGVGKEVTATYANRAFRNALSAQGPDAAKSFISDLKSVNEAQDHTSDSYKITNQLIKEWTRLVNDASAAQKANAGVTDDQADKVDRLGHVYDDSKSTIANWVEGFSDVVGVAQSAIAATQAVSDAQQKLADDDAKIAKLRGAATPDRSAVATASDKAATAQRGEAEASARLAATGRDLAAAKAELARIDKASDPSRYAAAERAVADADDARQEALRGLADAQGQAASAQRDLSSAQSAAVKDANDLANAEERIAAATRGQAAAQRELRNANRDLAEKRAELAHVDPTRDPNRYRQLAGEVADLADAQANAQDRVADADAAKRQSERDLVALRAEAKAKTDELAQAEQDRAKDSDALIQAIIQQKIAQAELFDLIKANPEAIPDMVAQIKDWADKAGGDAPAAAQQWIDKLNGIAFSAALAGDQLERILDGQKKLTDLGVGFIPGPNGNIVQSGVGSPYPGAGTAGKSSGGVAAPLPSGALSAKQGLKIGLGDYPLEQNGKTTSDSKGRPWHWDASRQAWIPEFATGGLIGGLGNTDSELIKAMPGEFVMRKAAVNKYGADFMRMLNSEAMPKYANGGFVGPVPGFDNAPPRLGGDRVEALLAEAVALLGNVGETHVHVDQRNYERPPGPADTARGVRSGMHLAGKGAR